MSPAGYEFPNRVFFGGCLTSVVQAEVPAQGVVWHMAQLTGLVKLREVGGRCQGTLSMSVSAHPAP